jgi:hypothetical protein
MNRQTVATIGDRADDMSGGGGGQGLSEAIVVDTQKVRGHLDEVVRSTVEQTLNQLLDEEADRIAGAGKYERSEQRKDFRAGSYQRKLQTKAGEVELTVPRLRKLPLETAIIATLVALLLPALGKARESARTAACLSNHRQLGIAWAAYINDYKVFPYGIRRRITRIGVGAA